MRAADLKLCKAIKSFIDLHFKDCENICISQAYSSKKNTEEKGSVSLNLDIPTDLDFEGVFILDDPCCPKKFKEYFENELGLKVSYLAVDWCINNFNNKSTNDKKEHWSLSISFKLM